MDKFIKICICVILGLFAFLLFMFVIGFLIYFFSYIL